MIRMGKRLVKNLLMGPATRMKPRSPFEKSRGAIDIDIDKCLFCGKCARECPSGCIKVDRKEFTWSLNGYECVICGVCVESCPAKAIKMNLSYRKPTEQKMIYKVKGKAPVRAQRPAAQRSAARRAEDQKSATQKPIVRQPETRQTDVQENEPETAVAQNPADRGLDEPNRKTHKNDPSDKKANNIDKIKKESPGQENKGDD